jgi:nitrogenase delta subunit
MSNNLKGELKMEENVAKEKMSQLEWYITKHCLWQYNSRGWDRLIQNERILTKTKQLLRGENAKEDDSTTDRYYWSEAMSLTRAFKRYFPWLEETSKEDIGQILDLLKERMDHTMVHASLNKELTKQQY